MEHHPNYDQYYMNGGCLQSQDIESFSPPMGQLRMSIKVDSVSSKDRVPRPRPVKVSPGVSCITSLLREEGTLNASIRRRRMQKWQARSDGGLSTSTLSSIEELPDLEIKAAKRKELARYFKNFIDVW